MKIGKKIIEFRKKIGKTQESLAREMGITRQTIASWESDITSPNLDDATKLAKLFGVTLDDLVNDGIAVECKTSHDDSLDYLIGKDVYIDVDCDDYRVNSSTLCNIISIDENYVKFTFKYGKKYITKLVDIDLIYSFKIVEKKVK